MKNYFYFFYNQPQRFNVSKTHNTQLCVKFVTECQMASKILFIKCFSVFIISHISQIRNSQMYKTVTTKHMHVFWCGTFTHRICQTRVPEYIFKDFKSTYIHERVCVDASSKMHLQLTNSKKGLQICGNCPVFTQTRLFLLQTFVEKKINFICFYTK